MKKQLIQVLVMTMFASVSAQAFDSSGSSGSTPDAQKKSSVSSSEGTEVECSMETGSCMRIIQEAALNYIVTGAPLSEGVIKQIVSLRDANPELQKLSDQELIEKLATAK